MVGVTLEIRKNEILHLGCKKVFTNVEDLVPVCWLNSRKHKLYLCHASFVQFPGDTINLIYFPVAEELLFLTFVAATF